MDGAQRSLETIGFFAVTGALVLALCVPIFWIRNRWRAREAAGSVAVAYLWEALVHALAVLAVILIGLVLAAGFFGHAA